MKVDTLGIVSTKAWPGFSFNVNKNLKFHDRSIVYCAATHSFLLSKAQDSINCLQIPNEEVLNVLEFVYFTVHTSSKYL